MRPVTFFAIVAWALSGAISASAAEFDPLILRGHPLGYVSSNLMSTAVTLKLREFFWAVPPSRLLAINPELHWTLMPTSPIFNDGYRPVPGLSLALSSYF